MKTERKLVKDLALAGYNYKGIDDLYRQNNLDSTVVSVILKWIPQVYEEHVGSGDHLTRSLISASEPFDPTALINLFENSNYNGSLKWGIAYVLASAKTPDISSWILYHLLEKETSFERSGLLAGLIKKAGIKTREELMVILKKLFEKYYEDEFYRRLYSKYAHLEDIPFLEGKLLHETFSISLNATAKANGTLTKREIAEAKMRYKKEILKIIKAIQERKKFVKFPPL